MSAGKVTSVSGRGNVFLPLIEGVYWQPVSRTVAQLAETKVDFSRVTTGTWLGRPAWIIGVASAADSTVPQIWIDQQRNEVLRMVLAQASGAPPMDVSLEDYVPVGRGWLATKVTMTVGGTVRQLEDYADWKVDVTFPDSLFDVSTWMTSPHWANR